MTLDAIFAKKSIPSKGKEITAIIDAVTTGKVKETIKKGFLMFGQTFNSVMEYNNKKYDVCGWYDPHTGKPSYVSIIEM